MPDGTIGQYHNKSYKLMGTCIYEQRTPEETVPWVIRIVVIPAIEENGPLITRYHHLAAAKLLLSSGDCQWVGCIKVRNPLSIGPVQAGRA
jgi:hypothetical protein